MSALWVFQIAARVQYVGTRSDHSHAIVQRALYTISHLDAIQCQIFVLMESSVIKMLFANILEDCAYVQTILNTKWPNSNIPTVPVYLQNWFWWGWLHVRT